MKAPVSAEMPLAQTAMTTHLQLGPTMSLAPTTSLALTKVPISALR